MEIILRYILIPYLFVTPITFGGIIHSYAIKKNILPKFKIPIDFGKTINSKRVFGNNKTFRGFFIMIIAGGFWGLMLYFLGSAHNLDIVSGYYINPYNSVLLGGVLGLIYLLGELPNSFIKRRYNIADGKRTSGKYKRLSYFIDQADSSISVVIYLLYIGIEPIKVFSVFVTGTLIHIIFDKALYALRVKQK